MRPIDDGDPAAASDTQSGRPARCVWREAMAPGQRVDTCLPGRATRKKVPKHRPKCRPRLSSLRTRLASRTGRKRIRWSRRLGWSSDIDSKIANRSGRTSFRAEVDTPGRCQTVCCVLMCCIPRRQMLCRALRPCSSRMTYRVEQTASLIAA